MSVLDKLDFKIDEKEKALQTLHTEFRFAMEIIYSEIEEKGYAMAPKKKIRSMLTRGEYLRFLQTLGKVFKIEHTKAYLIVFPKKN